MHPILFVLCLLSGMYHSSAVLVAVVWYEQIGAINTVYVIMNHTFLKKVVGCGQMGADYQTPIIACVTNMHRGLTSPISKVVIVSIPSPLYNNNLLLGISVLA